MVVCGIACLLNALFAAAAPYHTLPMALLLAYAHVPAILGLRFWRRFLDDPSSSRLVANLVEWESTIVGEAIETIKRGVLVAAISQAAASTLVVAGWALPPARIRPLPGGLGAVTPRDAVVPLWVVRAHGAVNWALLSLVILSILGQFAFFALYSYFHLIEVALTGERIVAHLESHYDHLEGDVEDGDGAESPVGGVNAQRPGADDAFSNLLEDVANDCKATQATLNSSCDAWSSIKMHYFFVCLAQILVVVQHIRLHTIGELKDLSYPYHYYAQDAVFLGVGVAAVGVIIVAAASVTNKCNEIKAKVKAVAYDHDTKFRASILSNVVNDHLSGVTCWGEPVNQQKIVMIMWGFTVVIFTIIVEILGAKFNIHKNPAIAL